MGRSEAAMIGAWIILGIWALVVVLMDKLIDWWL